MTAHGGEKAAQGPGIQFGHSVAAVDDPYAGWRTLFAITGFNSATASPPWMTSRFFGTSG